MPPGFLRVLVLPLAAVIVGPAALLAQTEPEQFVERPLVSGTSGMVTSLHPLSSMAGMQILMRGGNAFDAAVATAVASTVVDPKNSTIAGNGFATVYIARTGEVRALNFFGPAPRKATVEAVSGRDTRLGYLSVPVPSNLRGYQELLETYGTMTWAEVLEPAIQLAERGFAVPEDFSRVLTEKRDALLQFPTTAALFYPDTQPLRSGERLVQPDLARTLRAIAEEGPDVFYSGSVGRRIARFFQDNGGLLDEEDLARYRAEWVDPIETSYRGYAIYTQPPNSSALALLMQLNLLEGYDLAAMRHNSPEYLHLVGEVMRLVIADRNRYVADPKFVAVPVDRLISKEYATERRSMIGVGRTLPEVGPGDPVAGGEDENTTHLTVVDSHGNMVALTQTLGAWFGSGVVVDGVGVILSNQMRHLHLDPASPSRLEPGKRPRSNQSPTIVLRAGRPFMAIGTPGGDGIWQRLTQVLVNVIDFRMDIQTAITAPRMIYGGGQQTETVLPPIFSLEDRIPAEVAAALEELGFVVRRVPQDEGRLNGIVIDPRTGLLLGGADPRSHTYAIGW